MKKSQKPTQTLHTETVPDVFTPSQEQITALARRMIPEIKKFFADNLIRQEFSKWQERQLADN
jgi:hypothetical protein